MNDKMIILFQHITDNNNLTQEQFYQVQNQQFNLVLFILFGDNNQNINNIESTSLNSKSDNNSPIHLKFYSDDNLSSKTNSITCIDSYKSIFS